MARTRSTGLRDRLVDSVDELLDRHAPSELTTRQIAHQAAVSDGVLYNHFADKHELVVAALVRRYERLVTAFERRLTAAPGVGEGVPIETWLGAFARALRDLEVEALHVGAGMLADPRLLEAFWLEIHRPPLGLDRLRQPFVDRLRAEQGRGRVRTDVDVDAATTAVFGLAAMHALTVRLNHGIDRASADRDLEAGIGFLVTGLR
jgi:AcrR family transcriptional regulator